MPGGPAGLADDVPHDVGQLCRSRACNGATPSPVNELAGFLHIHLPTRYHAGRERTGARRQSRRIRRGGYKPLAQKNGQDTAAAWAAVAAWAITGTDPDRREIPVPGIVPPGVPGPRLPGVGPLPGP